MPPRRSTDLSGQIRHTPGAEARGGPHQPAQLGAAASRPPGWRSPRHRPASSRVAVGAWAPARHLGVMYPADGGGVAASVRCSARVGHGPAGPRRCTSGSASRIRCPGAAAAADRAQTAVAGPGRWGGSSGQAARGHAGRRRRRSAVRPGAPRGQEARRLGHLDAHGPLGPDCGLVDRPQRARAPAASRLREAVAASGSPACLRP